MVLATEFATTDIRFAKGGWRSVADTTERDAIPAARRTEGMCVYVISEESEYILDADLVTWNLKPGGSGGSSVSTITGTEGETLSNGNVCYLKEADSKWYKCDKAIESTCSGLLGIRKSSGTFQIAGKYTTTGLTTGATYYVGSSGALTTTMPSTDGDTIRVVGYANSTTELIIAIDQTYMVVGSGGGVSGGHTIYDAEGNALTKRSGLQFGFGCHVSDNSVTNKTEIDILKKSVKEFGECGVSRSFMATVTVSLGSSTVTTVESVFTIADVGRTIDIQISDEWDYGLTNAEKYPIEFIQADPNFYRGVITSYISPTSVVTDTISVEGISSENHNKGVTIWTDDTITITEALTWLASNPEYTLYFDTEDTLFFCITNTLPFDTSTFKITSSNPDISNLTYYYAQDRGRTMPEYVPKLGSGHIMWKGSPGGRMVWMDNVSDRVNNPPDSPDPYHYAYGLASCDFSNLCLIGFDFIADYWGRDMAGIGVELTALIDSKMSNFHVLWTMDVAYLFMGTYGLWKIKNGVNTFVNQAVGCITGNDFDTLLFTQFIGDVRWGKQWPLGQFFGDGIRTTGKSAWMVSDTFGNEFKRCDGIVAGVYNNTRPSIGFNLENNDNNRWWHCGCNPQGDCPGLVAHGVFDDDGKILAGYPNFQCQQEQFYHCGFGKIIICGPHSDNPAYPGTGYVTGAIVKFNEALVSGDGQYFSEGADTVTSVEHNRAEAGLKNFPEGGAHPDAATTAPDDSQTGLAVRNLDLTGILNLRDCNVTGKEQIIAYKTTGTFVSIDDKWQLPYKLNPDTPCFWIQVPTDCPACFGKVVVLNGSEVIGVDGTYNVSYGDLAQYNYNYIFVDGSLPTGTEYTEPSPKFWIPPYKTVIFTEIIVPPQYSIDNFGHGIYELDTWTGDYQLKLIPPKVKSNAWDLESDRKRSAFGTIIIKQNSNATGVFGGFDTSNIIGNTVPIISTINALVAEDNIVLGVIFSAKLNKFILFSVTDDISKLFSVVTNTADAYAVQYLNTSSLLTSGSVYGSVGNIVENCSSPSSADFIANYSICKKASSNNVSSLNGSISYIRSTGSGSVTNVFQYKANVSLTNLSVTNSYGYFGQGAVNGTVTNAYGMYLWQGSGGTITNNYGLYLGNFARGTGVNYAIYSAGGASYHAGNFTFGATVDAQSYTLNGSPLTTTRSTIYAHDSDYTLTAIQNGIILDYYDCNVILPIPSAGLYYTLHKVGTSGSVDAGSYWIQDLTGSIAHTYNQTQTSSITVKARHNGTAYIWEIIESGIHSIASHSDGADAVKNTNDSSVTSGRLALFDGTSGVLIKQSAYSDTILATSATYSEIDVLHNATGLTTDKLVAMVNMLNRTWRSPTRSTSTVYPTSSGGLVDYPIEIQCLICTTVTSTLSFNARLLTGTTNSPSTVSGWSSNVRQISSGAQTISINATNKTFTRSAGSFLTDGFLNGMVVVFSGFTNSSNNGMFTISTITDTIITCSAASGLVDETGNGDEYVVFGVVHLCGTVPPNHYYKVEVNGYTSYFATYREMRCDNN